jgi:hypothetical protein
MLRSWSGLFMTRMAAIMSLIFRLSRRLSPFTEVLLGFCDQLLQPAYQ